MGSSAVRIGMLSIFLPLYFWRRKTCDGEGRVAGPGTQVPLVTMSFLDTWLSAPSPVFLLSHFCEIQSHVIGQKTGQGHAVV